MDPSLHIGSHARSYNLGTGSQAVELGRASHDKLEKSPVYESDTHFDPKLTWNEKLSQGAKVAGLVVGAVVTGALALGLLPFTILGGILYLSGTLSGMSGMDEQDVIEGTASKERMQSIEDSQQRGGRLQFAGAIFAAPAIGFINCLNRIDAVAKDGDLFYIKSAVNHALVDVKKEHPSMSNESIQSLKANRWTNFEEHVGHLNKIKLKKLYMHVQKLDENNVANLGTTEKKLVLDYMRKRIKDLS
ncbi:MAG: hypothetical protein JSR37_09735 [Verrucomicrobia bacterium]|nr:hypothetical protein [Verrucomicrobiota bacterium]MBS0637278.1 hypothetical protein [Verrucomicrobiota bacterium]